MRQIAGLVAATVVVAAATLYSCGGSSNPGASDADAVSISLAHQPFASLEIPASARPQSKKAVPSEWISLDGHWDKAGKSAKGMHKWSTKIPIRPRGLFFHSAQPGMKLVDRSGRELVYDRFGRSDKPYWSHNKTKITVYFPDKTAAKPQPGDFRFTYPKALEREARLNYASSGMDSMEAFVRAEVHNEWETRNGLLLPAPSTVSWKVKIPKDGRFLFIPGLVEPEVVDDQPSDGVTLVVDVDGTEVHRQALKIKQYDQQSIDLSAYADQDVNLRVRMMAGATTRFDYAFLGQPILASRRSNPRRVVLIFVDTLRPDHMSLYGYERDTTLKLDAFAKGAVVFDNARSVAPWTLPSTRTVLTGMQPEHYAKTPTLQERLGEQGFATAMIAGNVYLSSNFDMARDWGLHTVGMWPRAEEVTDAAVEWLDQRQGHDAMLLVHYMDPHLPYVEPKQYRFMYAGEAQGGLREEFHLTDVRKANTRAPETRQYIQDRYDNNIRYATDQIDRILSKLDDDDVVVFFADHGEEFWDHGGFEHGHSLFDELLHVPLAIKGPGISGGRDGSPVSLLDITPTVLDLLGLPSDGLHGKSLVGVMSKDPAALEELASRNLAFGRPLYGASRWGVLSGTDKWTTHADSEELYDLSADPLEKTNLLRGKRAATGAEFRQKFGQALGQEMGEGYRLRGSHFSKGRPDSEMISILKIPGGAKAAWVEHDPLLKSKAEVKIIAGSDADYVVAVWHRHYRGGAIIWAIPEKPLEEVTHGLELCGEMSGLQRVGKVAKSAPAGLGGRRNGHLALLSFDRRSVTMTAGTSPIPNPDLEDVGGTDAEVNDLLVAMGYEVDDREDGDGSQVASDPEIAALVADLYSRCFSDEGSEAMP